MASSWGGLMAAQMGWPSMDEGWRKGPWTSHEDHLLINYVKQHGEGRWNSVSRLTELRRNGKSCRLRWVNYLRPDLKRGQITPLEVKIIRDLHARWGNRWSTIARSLPGRTDNEIKNYWRTHLKKKTKSSTDNTEKLRARLLRRQQFQQQQQLLQLQRQDQQEEEARHKFNQLDMKKIISLLEDDVDHLVSNNSPAQTTTPTMYWSSHGGDEKGLFYSSHANDTSASEGSCDQPPHHQQDTLWGGLWGMEDVQSNFLQHLVSPFY